MEPSQELLQRREHWHYRGQVRPPFAVAPAAGEESVWDYPRPPRIEAVQRRVRVLAPNGELVADSTSSRRVLETAGPPTIYIPPSDVATARLRPNASRSVCEWKGIAAAFDFVGDGDVAINNTPPINNAPHIDNAPHTNNAAPINNAARIDDATHTDNAAHIDDAAHTDNAAHIDDAAHTDNAAHIDDATSIDDVIRIEDAAWCYPDPFPEFAAIAGWLAFYPAKLECWLDEERVTPQPGGYYGGWITSGIVGPFKGEPGCEGL